MLRAMTLHLDGRGDEQTLREIGGVIAMVLQNGWWMTYRASNERPGDPHFVMDAGGNDDVAFAAGVCQSLEGELQIRIYLTKWRQRPSDFEGRLEVARITDYNEEDRCWLKYETRLADFVKRLALILEEYGVPIEKNNGEHLVALTAISDRGENFEREEKQFTSLMQRWVERMNMTSARAS